MSECTCHKNYTLDTLIPQVGVITRYPRGDTGCKDLSCKCSGGRKAYLNICPDSVQCCVHRESVKECFLLLLPRPIKNIRNSVLKNAEALTDYLHSLEVGDEITVRGPYGNHFPVEDKLKGKNLLFIAGGIGLAPLRSVINYVLDNREDYGTVDILYGSRSADDLVTVKRDPGSMDESRRCQCISYH